MRIEIYGFIIKVSENGVNKYDVYSKRVSNGDKTKGQIVESPEAFGVHLQRAIQIVAQRTTDEALDTVTLDEFIEDYGKIVDKILKTIQGKTLFS
jgi:hypothetical protein